ncbi:MAG: uncharacterized membrane protein YvlD (DUF360 family) [Ilumatobacter sp.]
MFVVFVVFVVFVAIIFDIVNALINPHDIDGFGSALLGAIIISTVSWALSIFLPGRSDLNTPKKQ